jgi:hypothetical protein
MKLTTSDDYAMNKIHVLLHGDSGIGKTTSMLTLPKQSTLIVLSERSVIPLRHEKFNVVRIDNWDDVRSLSQSLAGANVATDNSVSVTVDGKAIEGIKTVVFDSLSDINMFCIRQMIDIDRKALTLKRTEDRPEKKGGQVDTPDNIYEQSFTMEDWGELMRRMYGFVSATNHLPFNTIFTCLTTWREDKRTGFDRRIPAFHNSLAAALPAQFDIVLHMESNEAGERVWRTAKDDQYCCKDSSRALDVFEVSNWTRLFTKIFTNKEGK